MKDQTNPELLRSLVCTAMMRLGTRMAAEFDKQFSRFSLTQAQFRALLTICEEGGEEGIAPSVLADRLMIERATVSILTQRMVERGWLARRQGENRRTFRLILTPTGAEILQAVLPQAISGADAALAGVDPDDLQHMYVTLKSVEAHLRAGKTTDSQSPD